MRVLSNKKLRFSEVRTHGFTIVEILAVLSFSPSGATTTTSVHGITVTDLGWRLRALNPEVPLNQTYPTLGIGSILQRFCDLRNPLHVLVVRSIVAVCVDDSIDDPEGGFACGGQLLGLVQRDELVVAGLDDEGGFMPFFGGADGKDGRWSHSGVGGCQPDHWP